MAASERVTKPGRKRDASIDGKVLDAVLTVLARHGYDGTTIDLVASESGAARATIYRRWPTKADLVLAAVARLSDSDAAPRDLPDTGSLRGDLTALFAPEGDEEEETRMAAVAALLTMSRREPQMADAAYAAGLGPWIEVNRTLIGRAVERGEFPPPADLEALASLVPMMCLAQVGRGRAITREFSLGLTDGVLLPALRGGP